MSCDAELQELMIQVDKMVEDKKLEWQEKIKNAENKLNSTLQENFNLKSIIEDKNTEIAGIKNRFKYKDNMANILDYDQEVLQLRLELSQIKKSYEKYYHKYTKKIKEMEKDKEELCREKIDLLREVNELRNMRKLYNDERTHYQEQVSELELKRNKMFADNETLNEQLKLLKTDFNCKLNSFVESEKKYLHNVKELEAKLNESRQCLQHETEENKTHLSDMMLQTQKLVKDKQQLIIDSESAKRMIIRLENELSKFSVDNKMKEKTICKMEQVIKASEKTMHEKNEVIRALQVNSSSKDYVTVVSKLENELLEVKSHLKISKKNEKSLQLDISSLQKNLKEAHELIESEKKVRNQLETSLGQVSKTESEKVNLFNKINNCEMIIEKRTSETKNIKSQLEKLEFENEQLNLQLTQERDRGTKNNDNSNGISDPRRKIEEESFNLKLNQSADDIIKERNYLLKFCEDKDLIIHRLHMENRILQEFISKLNHGMSGETSFFTPDMVVDNYTSVSDIFHPLKETFTEYDPPVISEKYTEKENPNHNLHLSSQSIAKRPQMEYPINSSDSFSNVNFHHDKLHDHVNRSTEQFLSHLVRSESGDHPIISDNEIYTNLQPTLAAAKYFSEEREKTKQIEKMIDYHMNQLKKDTDYRRDMSCSNKQ